MKIKSTSLLKLIALLLSLMLLASCKDMSQNDIPAYPEFPPSPIIAVESPASSDELQTAAQSDMWRVELISFEMSDSLLTSSTAIQYGGGVVTTEHVVEPSRGHIFLLLELNIEKIGTGRASFSWADAHITDAAGNMFYRHPNDTFLANLNIPRIRGTDIVLGQEYGFVCYEIPNSADGLRFIADEGSIVILVGI